MKDQILKLCLKLNHETLLQKFIKMFTTNKKTFNVDSSNTQCYLGSQIT